jgi:hypothetical protein
MPEGVDTITDHDADVNVRGEPCVHLNTPSRGPGVAGARRGGLGDALERASRARRSQRPLVGERVAAPGS